MYVCPTVDTENSGSNSINIELMEVKGYKVQLNWV